jgi:hypothetical protein
VVLFAASGPKIDHGGARRGPRATTIRAALVKIRIAPAPSSGGFAPALAPAGAPVYEVWAAPLVLALIAAVGFAYLALAKPQRRIDGSE